MIGLGKQQNVSKTANMDPPKLNESSNKTLSHPPYSSNISSTDCWKKYVRTNGAISINKVNYALIYISKNYKSQLLISQYNMKKLFAKFLGVSLMI